MQRDHLLKMLEQLRKRMEIVLMKTIASYENGFIAVILLIWCEASSVWSRHGEPYCLQGPSTLNYGKKCLKYQ